MESNRVIAGTIGLFIVICLVGAVLAPMINDWATGESTTNEGAGWIRMEYLSTPDGSVQTTIGADGITVSRSGTDTQTGSDDTIIVATSTITVWWEDGHLLAMGQKFNGGDIIAIEATTEMDVQLLNAGGASRCEITIDNDPDTMIRFEMPTWAYLPKSTGNYGFFPNGTEVMKEDDKPLAAVGGGFAGVYANNAVALYGLPLTMQTSTTADGKIDGVTWVKASAQQDQRSLTPITLDIDTREADPDLPAVRSVPTPTYTDGDWGYETLDATTAKIVSYSGAGGGAITIPSTVGAYTVTQLGKGGSQEGIFANTVTATSITIPASVTKINNYAFYSASGITGTLTIPSSVAEIGDSAFYSCSGLTGLVIEEGGITTIPQGCFGFCTNLASVTIPEGVVTIRANAFQTDKITSLILPDSLKNLYPSCFDGGMSYNSGDLILPGNTQSIYQKAFNYFTKNNNTGTLLVPASVTEIGNDAFYNDSFTNVIIASEDTPGNVYSFGILNVTSVLDLSDTVDYSQNRYGLPAAATVQDNIGDALGYVSFTEIRTDPLIPGGAAAVMLAIPVVILASLIVVAATMFIRRE